jgi:tetrahydromethanopterin S-methyltransferase subunit G
VRSDTIFAVYRGMLWGTVTGLVLIFLYVWLFEG